MSRGRGGEVDVHAVLHRLGFRDGKDVDADSDGVGIGEAHGFDVGHAGFLTVNTPAERLRPEPADRGVVPGIYRNLNKPQRHAANPMLSWLNVMNRPERPYTTSVDVNWFSEHWRAKPHHHADRWISRDGCGPAAVA